MVSRGQWSFWAVALVLSAVLVPSTLAGSSGRHTDSTRNTLNDRRSPSPVRDLRVTVSDQSSVTLDWSRAWDNVGVEGYDVYVDGTRTTQTVDTHYTVRNLTCGEGYQVGVDAFDDAGNRSRKIWTFVSTAAKLILVTRSTGLPPPGSTWSL